MTRAGVLIWSKDDLLYVDDGATDKNALMRM